MPSKRPEEKLHGVKNHNQGSSANPIVCPILADVPFNERYERICPPKSIAFGSLFLLPTPTFSQQQALEADI
jgi:hypothetical protein